MNKIITFLSLLTFTLLKNVAFSQTVNVPIYFTGYTNECCVSNTTPYTCFNDGGTGNCGSSASSYSTTFTNPIPAGNVITQVSISYYTFECPGTTATPMLNGFTLSTGSVTTGACLCATGAAWSVTASSADNYICGIPNYNYMVGAAETFQVSFSGQVCISQALITFSYVPASQATAPPIPTMISGDTSYCMGVGGNSYSITPIANATSYAWSVPGDWTINSGQGTNSISTTSGGSGFICVNASNACGVTSDYCILVTATSSSPTVSLGWTNDTICSGSEPVLHASGASSYTWIPGTTLSDSTIATPIASPTTTTVYTVTGSNVCGFAIPQTATVTVLPTPGTPVLSGINNPLSLCQGTNTVLNVTPSGSFYQTWYDGIGNHISTGPTISISDTTIETDYYTVADSSGANGCIGSPLTIVVNIYPVPVLTNYASSTNSICFGLADTLSVTGFDSYIWVPSAGLNIDTGSVVIATPSVTTSYSVTGTIAGCSSSVTGLFTIPVYPVTNVSYTLVQDTAPQTWDVYPVYSSNVASVSWDWGDTTTPTIGFYPSHVYAIAGKYSICVTVTDSIGCTATYCQNDSVYRLANNNNVYSNMLHVNVDSVQGQTTHINKFVSNNEINIYPNPNNGSFIIETNSTTKQSLQVYDINGKLVLTQVISGRTSIDAGILNDGVYNISLLSNGGVINKRLVIVR